MSALVNKELGRHDNNHNKVKTIQLFKFDSVLP